MIQFANKKILHKLIYWEKNLTRKEMAKPICTIRK